MIFGGPTSKKRNQYSPDPNIRYCAPISRSPFPEVNHVVINNPLVQDHKLHVTVAGLQLQMSWLAWLLFTVLVAVLLDSEALICKYEFPKANANDSTRLRSSWTPSPNTFFCNPLLELKTKPVKLLDGGHDAEACMRACEAEPKCVAINHFHGKSRCELFTRICKSPLQKREGASAYVFDRAAFSTKRKGG